jgi:hypothetical protein
VGVVVLVVRLMSKKEEMNRVVISETGKLEESLAA